jgi:hypothetical protein
MAIDVPYDALQLAKLTPASGWGKLPDPSTVKTTFTKAELEARIRRAFRQLGAREPGETYQDWADRLGRMDEGTITGKTLFHTIRVAYLNLEALS